MDHKDYMRRALELAAQAGEEGDVPVGCVIVIVKTEATPSRRFRCRSNFPSPSGIRVTMKARISQVLHDGQTRTWTVTHHIPICARAVLGVRLIKTTGELRRGCSC